jgi:integrase
MKRCFLAAVILIAFSALIDPARVDAQNLLWAKRGGGSSTDTGQAIAVDSLQNSYVTGQFFGTATFGVGEPNQTTLTASSGFNLFVAKYNPNGLLLWAKGGGTFAAGFGIAVDASGNSYVTGTFTLTAIFGPGEANQTTLTSAGGSDVFVAKYNSNGALVWAKRAGGTAGTTTGDTARSVAVDTSGNSYVTGQFLGTAIFGAGEPNQTTLTAFSSSDFDIFVAKYDLNGLLLWAKGAGGFAFEQGLGIAVDSSGNSFVTGSFESTGAVFGLGETNQTTLILAGSSDAFVAKYDSNGALVWAKGAGGVSTEIGNGIVADGSGNSYVTGTFSGAATFGAGGAGQTTLNSAGGSDVFVAKYNSNGALVWAKSAGGTSADSGNDIAVDSLGNSYVTGFFFLTATFGTGEANQTMLTSAGNSDIFVAKYDPNGALVWAKGAGASGAGLDQGTGVAVDSAGNSYATGQFTSTATFGAGEANPTVLTSAGSNDVFIAKFAGSGGLAHLDVFFRNARVAAIGGTEITAYAAERQRQGAANGTINRELATLGRMLKLAYEHHKCLRLPVIHRLKEAPPRKGFFEPAEFEAVKKRLPEDLAVAVTIAYLYGWRMQSEVLALERRHVNLDAGTLTLDAEMTKTDEARTVYLTPEVKVMLAARLERVDAFSRKTERIIPSLFPHLSGRHRGEPRLDFRKRWITAFRKAGVPGRLRHDFRHTAVRNMVNAGVPENVAMTVTGHKTRAVFDRYHIVSPADLKAVAVKLAGTV